MCVRKKRKREREADEEGGERQIVEGNWLKRREVGMWSANALSEGARQQENGRWRTHPLDTE